MQDHADEPTPRKTGHIFYYIAITSLLVGIATTLIQKRHESGIAAAEATGAGGGTEGTGEHNDVRKSIEAAERWQILSLAEVSLGMLSWGAAVWRREKHRWAWACVLVLLSVAVILQLTMV